VPGVKYAKLPTSNRTGQSNSQRSNVGSSLGDEIVQLGVGSWLTDQVAAAAERMYTRVGDRSLYTLARAVEATAIRLLEECKPGRRLQTNVEFYTALLLHGLGLDAALFTPTFAVSRVSGWIAHAFEQRGANRIIRPQSEYAGPRDRKWVPLSDRIDTPAARRAG